MFPSPSEFESLLNKLESVNLASESAEKELYKIFKKLETLPVVSYQLSSKFPMTRARLNIDGERFSDKKQLWHKPKELNKGFGRASNPHVNVFYGAIDPYPPNDSNDKPVERITALCEVSNIYFTEPEETDSEVVTFSRWVPGKHLKMICPFDFSKLSSESEILKEMNDEYLKVLDKNEEYQNQIARFHTYISNQFSKYPISNEFEYKRTALFSEIVISMGFDGIIYPSVKTDLKGFNVAINSELVEDNFQLFAVGECTHFKKKKYSYINMDLLTDQIENDGSFTLTDEHPYSLSREQIQELIDKNTT